MARISKEIFDYFSRLIERDTGIQYNDANGHLLENRLRDLSMSLGFDSLDSLWKDIQVRGLTPHERDLLLDSATNNETSFFRDPEIFDFFKSEYVPKETNASERLKIWCAASSTGQEPYSLAMTFAQLKDVGQGRNYEILATDFSSRVLAYAKQAVYTQFEVQRGLAPDLLARFFTTETTHGSPQLNFKLKPELSASIIFRKQNLIEPWSDKGPFHIIFCRNVLIYQDIANKRKIIERMAKALKPQGYLILGGAESLLGLSSAFDMKIFGKACVYKLKSDSILAA